MTTALPALRSALRLLEVRTPRVRVISSLNAREYRDATHVRTQLPRQLVGPVRWEQCLHVLYARSVGEQFPRTYTLGPGDSLRHTLRRVNAKAWDCSVQIDA